MVAPAQLAAIAAQVVAQQQRRRQEAQQRQEASNAEIRRLTEQGAGAPMVSAQPTAQGSAPASRQSRMGTMLARNAMQRQNIRHPLQGLGQIAQAAAARYLMSQQGAGNDALLGLTEPESNPEIEALLMRGEI